MNHPYQLPAGDPYLPPGCTQADIDRAFGCDPDEFDICEYCGGRCRHGNSMCAACAKQDYDERKRDEEKDEQT